MSCIPQMFPMSWIFLPVMFIGCLMVLMAALFFSSPQPALCQSLSLKQCEALWVW
uniref:ATP synthase F0 subunit 8 n=1 Tax=Antrokoreana gracilipes TaxID=364406 RepID=A9X4I1_ANTGC|nr:ATP synthase F0 subunit 8 [Antrokoreana gracilipes]ABC55881.1 ATP synthase F0 subunit 8 [Antrokoreana gracilipes]